MSKSHPHNPPLAERVLVRDQRSESIGWYYVASMLALYSFFAALVLWTMLK